MPEDKTPTDAENQVTDTQTGEDAEPAEVTFTDAQQKAFDDLVKSRLDRQQKAFDRRLEKERQAAVEAHKAESEAVVEDTKQQANSDTRVLKGKLTKAEKEIARLTESKDKWKGVAIKAKVDDVILSEAASLGFNDPNDAKAHIGNQVKFDPVRGEVFVVDSKGNDSGETVKELLASLAATKDYLIKPKGSGNGSGSHVGEPGRQSDKGGPEPGSREWKRAKLRQAYPDRQ